MSRLIREEDVIKEIDEWLDIVGVAYVGKGLSYYGELLGCISDAPTVDVHDTNVEKWIPCDKKSPKEFKRVYVTYLGYHDNKPRTDNCAYLKNGMWLWDLDDSEVNVEVVAWKPLMEPYKKED